MSPVNLGDLPSGQPAPTGLCQIKRGNAETAVTYNSTVAQGTVIYDGAGVPMRIAITPTRAGWWVVRAETIWTVVESAWPYFTWLVNLSPADADGFSQAWNHMSQHAAQGWQESCIDVAYRLNANTAYTATMCWGYAVAGYNMQMYAGAYHTNITGEFVGEGAL